ncbi:MRPL47 [Cordylochernes scorpioides]|uniref:Large ribosomal subunit protein uL29m n=1 Tax=Cordylochernes scorpioides TaxID=51811 RepID=A0ABY6LPG0_9ARAC|nr:MRPL47 [Cordylochernes scorpioides]
MGENNISDVEVVYKFLFKSSIQSLVWTSAKRIYSPTVVIAELNQLTRNFHAEIESGWLVIDVRLKWLRCLHASSIRSDLMEFFDSEENWKKQQVRSGRSWKKDELRIKSNEDLHKLWYVLLKEKNMLLTMEEAALKKNAAFQSPERLDKVEESMENLEEVVKERNKAYYELETGKSGLRELGVRPDIFGRIETYQLNEYYEPASENPDYTEPDYLIRYDPDVDEFLRKMNEKMNDREKEQTKKDLEHIRELFTRFPELDKEALQEKYPKLDIEKIHKEYIYKYGKVSI